MSSELLQTGLALRDLWRTLIAKGQTLATIADQYGVSRERVRQVVSDNDRDTGWMRAMRGAREQTERDLVVTTYRSLKTLAATARATEMSVAKVRRVLLAAGVTPFREPPSHGTRTRYVHYKCRCDACTKANTTHIREYYQKRRKAQ